MLDFLLVYQAFANEKERKFGERVPMGFLFALFRSFVELLVVGKRVRIRASDLGMDQRRTAPLSHVLDGFLQNAVAL